MSTDKTDRPFCEKCRFFKANESPAFPGDCRRNPPIAIGDGATGWPDVHPDDFCGEYRRKDFSA